MLAARSFEHRYVPAKLARQKSGRERVLVVLHGLGDSLRGFSFLPEALNIETFSYLFLNAPDSYYGGYSWYDYPGESAPGIRRSREKLLQLLDELKEQGVAARDIFLFGFSQGCLMVTDLALRSPDVLGGVCGVSGYVAFMEEYPEHFSPVAKNQRLLITHGYRDPMVAFEPASRQFEQLQKLGIPLEFRVYDKDHTILPEELEDISAWFRARISAS
jgi:phospholipase/carboxylesterase